MLFILAMTEILYILWQTCLYVFFSFNKKHIFKLLSSQYIFPKNNIIVLEGMRKIQHSKFACFISALTRTENKTSLLIIQNK